MLRNIQNYHEWCLLRAVQPLLNCILETLLHAHYNLIFVFMKIRQMVTCYQQKELQVDHPFNDNSRRSIQGREWKFIRRLNQSKPWYGARQAIMKVIAVTYLQ